MVTETQSVYQFSSEEQTHINALLKGNTKQELAEQLVVADTAIAQLTERIAKAEAWYRGRTATG
jgi:hypothetical protein